MIAPRAGGFKPTRTTLLDAPQGRVLRLDLSEQEVAGLRRSAGVLKKTIAQLGY
ncbi:MAG: hypothetical protein ACJ74J_23850 [Blastocatellia bacterium]